MGDAISRLVSDVKTILKYNTYVDEPRKPALAITSQCPSCGSPIFSSKILFQGGQPEVRFSCECRHQKTMEWNKK